MIALKARVVVSKPIAFGGGTSPWVGRFGTVTKLLRGGRAVLVRLDDDGANPPFLFFVRELDVLAES